MGEETAFERAEREIREKAEALHVDAIKDAIGKVGVLKIRLENAEKTLCELKELATNQYFEWARINGVDKF